MYTFDIFDTLITRATATPTGIFVLMQQELMENVSYVHISEYLRENFFYIRKNAERYIRDIAVKKGKKEITIGQIYDVIQTVDTLDEQDRISLINLELETEKKFALPITENINKYKHALASGEKPLLISDMYMSESEIRDILVHVDEIFEKAIIYVSSECDAVKKDGSLFAYAAKNEKIGRDDWIHIGDSIKADLEGAERFGIKAKLYRFPDLKDFERNLLIETSVEEQLLFGLARYARITNGAMNHNFAFSFGSSVGVGILLSYVLWIFSECQKRGIRKLYFIARDGFVLEKIAQEIKAFTINCNIEIKYIYGSREAWRLSDKSPFMESKIQPLLKSEKALLLKRYLKQEITGEGKKVGFVDVQGSGISEIWLSQLLPETKITTFLIKKVSDYEQDLVEFAVYMPGQLEKSNVVETLTRATHGRTVGYKENENHEIVPIFKDDENQLLMSYGYCNYLQGITDMVPSLLKYTCNIRKFNWNRLAWRLMDYLMFAPSKSVLDYLGDMPFVDQINGKEQIAQFAPRLNQTQILLKYLKDQNLDSYHGVSIPFSIMRFSDKDVLMAQYYKKLRNRRNRTRITTGRYVVDTSEIRGKIILYGAGKMGQSLYSQLKEEKGVDIIKWVDIDAVKYQQIGLPVEQVESIKNCCYDMIVIGVVRDDVVCEIKKNLVSSGIEERMIYWRDYRRNNRC